MAIQKVRDKQKSQNPRDIIAALQLKPDELKLVADFRDPKTNQIINIPVTLFERIFDWNTVLDFNGEDPFTDMAFTEQHVMPASTKLSQLEMAIERIKEGRRITPVVAAANEGAEPPQYGSW